MTARVGPVLEAGEVAEAVVAVIRQRHPDVEVQDRGSYLRVGVPGRCVMAGEAVAGILGRPFRLPGDLELVMLSFSGRFAVSEHEAVWTVEDDG